MVFGKDKDKGIKLEGFTPVVVSLKDGKYSVNDLIVHNEKDTMLSFILARMSDIPHLPRPAGVLYAVSRPLYEAEVSKQIQQSIMKQGEGNLEKLLNHGETWTIQ